jgi:sulfofructose kinase
MDCEAMMAQPHFKPKVVGLGYCVYDILAVLPHLPDFDDVRMTHLTDLAADGGGQVGTALTALARLGAQVGYIGSLGNDREGHWLRELFLQDGVDVARLRFVPGAGTNICLILVEQATGRRSILCHQRVRPEDLILDELDRAYIQAAQVLHLDGQFMPAALQAAHWIKAAGGRVCFDGNHPRPGLDELLPLVDWLVVAQPFPPAYTGLSNADEAARALLAFGIHVLVVTEGPEGCRVWTAHEHFEAPAFRVTAVDTTGAGDAFHGAFIYAMLQGWDLGQAATFANALAALNCRTLGGRKGLPSLAEVRAFMEGTSTPRSAR